MNSRVRGSFLSLEGNKKKTVGKGRKKGKKKKIKEKEKKGKRERNKRENKRKNKKEGECKRVIGKKKEGTTLPFPIFGEPMIETRQGKRQS